MMLMQSKMGRWSLPSPSPSPLPLPRPQLQPKPQPYPSPHHSIPCTRPTFIIESASSQITNDNALFQHVCFATNLGGLTLIESTIILFAEHLCFVHTTHTPCSHHNTDMLNSMVFNNPPYPTTPTPPPQPTARHQHRHNRNTHNHRIGDGVL